MKVLFAIEDENNIIDSLTRKYKIDFDKKMSYTEAKNFTAIIKEIQQNNNYDRIVISENFDSKINNSDKKEAILLKRIKGLLSIAKGKRGKNIPIIFLGKNDGLVKYLMDLNIYNFLIGKDVTKKNIYELIINPRNISKAKEYYKSISKLNQNEVIKNKKMDITKRLENKMEVKNNVSIVDKYIAYLNKPNLSEEKYVSKFESACEKLDSESINTIISSIKESTKKILKKNSKKYNKLVEKNNKKEPEKQLENKKRGRGRPRKVVTEEVVVKEKKKRGRPRKNPTVVDEVEEEKVAKRSTETDKKKSTEAKAKKSNKNTTKEEKKVSNKDRKNKSLNDSNNPKVISEFDIDDEMQNKKNFEYDDWDLEDDDILLDEDFDLEDNLDKKDHDLNLKDNDRDLDLDDDEEDLDLDEDEEDLDLDEDEEDLDLDEEEEDLDLDEDEEDLDLDEDEEDSEDNDIMNLDDEEDSEDDDIMDLDDEEDSEADDIMDLDDEKDSEEENIMDLDDEEDSEADDIMDLDDEEDSEDDDIMNLDEEEDLEDDDIMDLDDEEDLEDNVINLDDDSLKIKDKELSSNNETNNSTSGIKNKNYIPNFDISKQLKEINNEESSDKSEFNDVKINNNKSLEGKIKIGENQKIVSFVGSRNSGNSFLINNIAHMLSEQGVKTAIVDLTKNKNSYYIYTENEENLRSIAYSCFEKLKSGIADGIKVNKNLTVYTSLPNSDEEIEHKEMAMSTLLNNYSLILLDCDFDTNLEYFNICQEIYFVQSLDILTIQTLTGFIKKLKMNKIGYEDKMKIVINKYVNVSSINEKAIVAAISVYNSPDTTYQLDLFDRNKVEYFLIPFEEKNYCKYLDEIIRCKLSIRGYSKSLINSLNKLVKSVYPINGKKYKSK